MDWEVINRYLAGDAGAAEKKEVAAWAKADEKNMKMLRTLRRLEDVVLWSNAGREKSMHHPAKRKGSAVRRMVSIAAVFALLAGNVCYIRHIRRQIPPAVMQTIHVPPGQRAELLLADGTGVWLNAGTTFSFPGHFASNERTVLLDGEAYVHVRKDADRPFIVKTPFYDVKAVGTEFNVLAYSQSSLFEVSLLNGSVEVHTAEEKIGLEPQTRLWRSGNGLQKGKLENTGSLLWKEGLICFDDEPVEQMTDKLELYFDTRIVIENRSFLKKRYTGKFRIKDGIEHMLKVFQLKDRFTYHIDDETNVITIN
ncbi:MAG: FecR domain-containing protein [Tannerella sp.]|jgi:ferric-dicitrate binding protein FerR (iron transport regulator)|nr:FecR domain-containing protein [Tannerella sp.]